MSGNAAAIYEQVKHLNKADQRTLLERLELLVRQSSQPQQSISLLSLSGLGAEIWGDTDVDAYLNEERRW